MKRAGMKGAVVALLLLAVPAMAQAPGQPGQFLPVVPPPGAIQSAPLPPPAGAAMAPNPAVPGAAAPNPGVGAAPVAPVTPDWLPQATAELRALDKVTARTATVTGKLGDSVRFGSLTIVVQQCVVRPPDRAPDAAAWLDISDANGGPGFKGWMLASLPSVSMLEHPGYDIRVTGCRP